MGRGLCVYAAGGANGTKQKSAGQPEHITVASSCRLAAHRGDSGARELGEGVGERHLKSGNVE
jgi:hypothetical protein